MKSADHKRWSLSLAAALALHLAAITVVGWLWSPRPVPRDTPAVEHDVQVVMVPPARPAVRPLVVAPRRARVQVARPAPRRTHQSRRRAPARSRPPARSSSSLNLEPVEPLSLRMRQLELSLSPDDPSARATGAPRGKKKAKVAARQLSEAEVVKGRIDGWLRDGKAATNARHGRGHPALFDLLRGADGNYRPTLAMIPARLDRARRDTYRAWQAAVKQFNKIGRAHV